MPFVFSKLTPNLIVSDVDRSVAFYRDVLGFTVAMHVPDQSPYVFAGVRKMHDALAGRVKVVMPLEKKWYGLTEFAITDPDGYIITFAEQEPRE